MGALLQVIYVDLQHAPHAEVIEDRSVTSYHRNHFGKDSHHGSRPVVHQKALGIRPRLVRAPSNSRQVPFWPGSGLCL
jgi:hypothetical protein